MGRLDGGEGHVGEGDLLHEDNVGGGPRRVRRLLPWIAGALLVLTLTTFFLSTPPGVLEKADMVGYAVCHQIDSHTFAVAGRYLPLCARCTGTFLGALVGLVGQALVLRRRRAAAFPSNPILAILLGFTLVWAIDGLNSYLALVGGPHAYEPANELRLVTGALNGLTMSALIYPVVNISVWRSPIERPAIRGPRDLGVLLLMEAGLIALVLSRPAFLLYPLSLTSAVAVLTLLTFVNLVIVVIVMGQENAVETWRETLLPVSVALLLSLIQIGLMDLARYALTGTLDGLSFLQ